MSTKALHTFAAVLSILAPSFCAADSLSPEFIKNLILNGGLKQAVKSYIQTQSKEIVNLKADQADPIAVYFFESDKARKALLKDIDRSEYEADLDGSQCSELQVQGRANEKVEAKTQFGVLGAGICFNVPGIAQYYQSRSQEEGVKLLVSYALHEHTHHFQKDPGSNESARENLEHQAYDFQSFVLNTVSSGVAQSLQYGAKTADVSQEPGLGPFLSPNTHLVPGDKVLYAGQKCENYISKKDPFSGVSVGTCEVADVSPGEFDWDHLLLTTIPTSDLTVVAVNSSRGFYGVGNEVAVTGTIDGKPVSMVISEYFLARRFGGVRWGERVGDSTVMNLHFDVGTSIVTVRTPVTIRGIAANGDGLIVEVGEPQSGSKILRYVTEPDFGLAKIQERNQRRWGWLPHFP